MDIADLFVIVAGDECVDNMRLTKTCRRILGDEQVRRVLELRHLYEAVDELETNTPVGIFLDIFSYDLLEAIEAIGTIRQQYPGLSFCLYVSHDDHKMRWKELPQLWRDRLTHYYRLYKATEDSAFEPVVRRVLHTMLEYDLKNMHKLSTKTMPIRPQLFVSYARVDSNGFVEDLVERLRAAGQNVWIDQHLIVGGDDWMDAIGEALETCMMLLLVMSPEALASKYVKMEYRYFFNHDKPIIPVLYRAVEKIPPELMSVQHLDFTTSDPAMFDTLLNVLAAKQKSLEE